MSVSARNNNYSETQETYSKHPPANSLNKKDRQFYVLSGTSRHDSNTDRSDGRPYGGLDTTSRAKVVSMAFENVTDTVRISNASVSERSGDPPRRRYDIREIPPKGNVTTEKFTSSYRSTVNRNELEDSRRDDRHRDKNLTDEGSGFVNSSHSTASSSGDISSRSKPIDRNQRSVTTTSSLGIVTATKTEVPLRSAALREDFTATERSGSTTGNGTKLSAENRNTDRSIEDSQTRSGRRRRRVAAATNEHSEPTTAQSILSRKQVTNASATKSTSTSAIKKFSPYPNYIQPVTVAPSYPREVNRILSHGTRSSPYNHRNRKISTDMNRYESSSSKSSSSDSENETVTSRTAPLTKPKNRFIERIAPETPDTSDCENKPGLRTRRVAVRMRGKATPKLQTPNWEDKYGISLPDDYKQPEAFAHLKPSRVNDANPASGSGSPGRDDKLTTVETSRQRLDDQRERTDVSNPGEYRRNRRSHRVIINQTGISQNREGIGSSLRPSRSADLSLSTPDLVRVDRQTSGSNEVDTANTYRRKPSESGESEKGDITSPSNRTTDVVNSKSPIEHVEYEVIQRQPKITARKVGEDFWPRDEATVRLLTHPRATSNHSESPEATVGSRSAASCAMQETIDQLQSFVNETTRHRPLGTDRSKSQETVSGRASPSYAGIRRGSNWSPGIHGQQSSKTNSPHMSSTETLKESGSSGEYQGKNSRSPSFDSTASNPERGGHSSKNFHSRTLSAKENTQRPDNNIVATEKTASADDISLSWQDGTSTLKKLHELTEAMKNFKIPQPSQADPVTVSSPNSISASQSKLETLSEYPEPISPLLHKRPSSKKKKGIAKQEVLRSADSLEIDEGVVTDELQSDESVSILKFDHYEGKSSKRDNFQMQPVDKNDGSESSRSRSDPSAERKRIPPSNKSIDNGLIGVMHNKQDIGSSGQSLGGSSQLSEQPSSFSDTLNMDELILEEKQDELEKLQIKDRTKKKSKSDPNPDGVINLGPETGDTDNGYNPSLASALSEPNVLEKMDSLGPLDRFQSLTGSDGLHVRVAPSIRRPKRIKLPGYTDGPAPTSTRSISSSIESEGSSPLQKQGDEILFQESEEFEKILKGMKGDKEQMSKPAVVHARSSSEPVDNVDYTQSPRYKQKSPYGGSTFNLPRPRLTGQNTDDHVFTSKENFAPDKRLHVFENLLDTEKSYVNSLKILCEDYMTPLRNPANHLTCEPRLVDEIFYKIPQLLQHHEKFYESVKKCHRDWNTREIKLGELFLNSFNKDALLDTYTEYITHYFNAREAVRIAAGKEAFRRFLEQNRCENKDKYGLDDLMIKPVQRIPRYELLIKDMLKHTPADHVDRNGLQTAQKEIHKLAEHMNKSEKEAEYAERQDRLLNELEQLIEGCVDLSVPKRRFIRQDIVTEISSGSTKKDRSLWLFNDLIVCTTRKGRGGTAIRRGSIINLYFGPDRTPNIEPGYKYKFLWRFPLEDVDCLKGGNASSSRPNIDRQLQTLQSDLDLLTSIQQTASKIESYHGQLDDAVREIMGQMERQLSENLAQRSTTPGRIELGVTTTEGVKTFLFELFPEDKLQFERSFTTAKRSLTSFRSRWEPTFMKAIPIIRARSGMQFSCAAPNVDAAPDSKEVWVCNTDGIVGQVCILALEPVPNQTQCITVCEARICCIAHVPMSDKRYVPAHVLLNEMATGAIAHPPGSAARDIMSWDDDLEESDEESNSPHSTLSNYSSPHSQSPLNTVNGGFRKRHMKKFSLDSMLDMRFRKKEHPISPDLGFNNGGRGDNGSMDCAFRIKNDGTTLHGSLDELLQEGDSMSSDALSGMDAMWLGSDDGMIHIFPASQSSRANRHCVKRSLNAPVHNILYHVGQVFVSLSNGELLVYDRNVSTHRWDLDNYRTKHEKSPRAITKMVVVAGKELWCGCQNMIKIIDMKDLSDIDSFAVSNDPKRQVFCMVNYGLGVWVALDKRPQIKLYHTMTHEILADIDVSNPVNKMLASADAIIRQHKAACLRITALLVCNGLLWMGTSAGVVLTVTLPKITPQTSALAMPVIPQGLAYGHTGHVRFLACAEIPDKESGSMSRGGSRRASSNKRRSSSSNTSNQPKTVSIIISGGDGYEDFRANSNSESAGREDSINHLLVWRA